MESSIQTESLTENNRPGVKTKKENHSITQDCLEPVAALLPLTLSKRQSEATLSSGLTIEQLVYLQHGSLQKEKG